MPATSQLMNETLMEVEHTPPVHKRILDLLPGVSGGVARVMVGQPFDTIKTRMQVLGKGTIGAQGMPPDMVYNSGMDCVRKMVSAQGLGCVFCRRDCAVQVTGDVVGAVLCSCSLHSPNLLHVAAIWHHLPQQP
jgi:hypothetical protein